MPAVPTLRSVNDVLNWFNDQQYSAWEMYRFKPSANYRQALYHGKDKDEATRRLIEELNRIHHDDAENYYLALGTTKGVKDKNFEQVVGMYFVVNEKPSNMMGVVPPYYMQRGNNDNEILNEIRALRAERLAEMQDEEDEEDEQPVTASSILAGMLQQPQVQNMLITILGNIAGTFMKPNVQHVSGTHTAEDLQKIIDTLFSKGVTPDDLAKLAEMPQSQITMLLSMLRK